MGSHRARHRADHNQSEELATDLLARLADEATQRPTPTRHAATRPPLDPFSTAPFPARTPRAPEETAGPDAANPNTAGTPHAAGGRNGAGAPHTAGTPGSAGTPHTAGTPTGAGIPTKPGTPAGQSTQATPGSPDGAAIPTPPPGPAEHPLGLRTGPAAELSSGYGPEYGTRQRAGHVPGQRAGHETGHGGGEHSGAYAFEFGAEPSAYVPAPRFPSDPDAPFPLEDPPAGLIDAPRTGRDRLAALRRKPIYAAVSATMITATAAVAASAGPTAVTPQAPTPERSPSLAAAALDLASPAQPPGKPGGVAVPAPGQVAVPAAAPVLGSTIVARAAADAKIFAEAQARQAATRAGAPGHAPKLAPKPAVKPAPKPAAKPAAAPAAPAVVGSSVAARALALARGKVGTPYVWGAAGPSAFDCSGLIVWAYQQLGVSLPHSSATLSTMGTPVAKAALQPGDLVYFYSPVSHVGIYAGNGMVLNATQSGEPVQFSKLANLPFHNAMRITK